MNTDINFDLVVAVSFTIIPQMGVIGTQKSDIIISITHNPNETIPVLNIYTLRVCIKIILVKNETFQKNAPTRTYICEIYKLPALHRYMANYEIEYKKFIRIPHSHHLTNTFHLTIELKKNTWDLQQWYEFRHQLLNFLSHNQYNLW